MKVLNMTKKDETPRFAFRFFIEDNSVIVAISHNPDGTSVNTGERVPDEERDGFVPFFGLRFFQEGSLTALITKCNQALDALRMLKGSDPEPVNIDLALAQIADMEAAQNPAAVIPVSEKPLTWNERINQMTVEEKVEWLNGSDYCRVTEIPIFECDAYKDCKECMRAFLNSPYTEGETDEG